VIYIYRINERILINDDYCKYVDRQLVLILRALSDKKCLDILNVISIEPSYVGKIASMLRTKESRVSEKIRMLKEAGMITEEWKRDGNKLLKYLKPSVRKISISLDGGIDFEMVSDESKLVYEYAQTESSVPVVRNFVGRTDELNFLERNSHVMIVGIPGIGKSSLAANFVNVRGRNTFWYEIREIDNLDIILSRMAIFLHRIGEDSLLKSLRSSNDKRFQVSLAIALMRNTNTTLVFDDVHKCKDTDITELIEDFLKSVPEVKIILIARYNIQITSSSLKTLVLGELKLDEAKKLAQGRKISSLKRAGGHPLLLRITCSLPDGQANRAGNVSPEEYISGVIFPNLSGRVMTLLEKLSFFRGRVKREDAEFVFGKFNRDDLHMAESAGLLKVRNEIIYINDLLKEAAYKRASNKEDVHLMLSKFFLSKNSSEYLVEGFYHLWKSRKEKELSVFLDDYGIELVDSEHMNNFQKELLEASESMDMCETKALMLFWAGRTFRNYRNYEKALECFSKARTCPHSFDLEVRIVQSEAVVLQYMGDLQRARDVLEAHISLIRERNENIDGNLLNVLGRVLTYLGKMEEAENILDSSTKIFSTTKGSRGYCVSLVNKAFMEYVKGNVQDAWEINENATECFLNLNSRYGYVAAQQTRAFILESMGEIEKAVEKYSEVIEILEGLRFSRSDVAFTLMKRSIANMRLGKLKEAAKDVKVAKNIILPTGDELLKGMMDYVEGKLLLHMGKMREAEMKLARGMLFEAGDPIFLCGARMEMARLYTRNGKSTEARELITGLIDDLKHKKFLAFLPEAEEAYHEIFGTGQK